MNAFWLSFAERGAQTLWLWSWQAAILLGCVWAGLKLLRVASPALRHHVWLLGLLAVTLLPLAPKLLPAAAPTPWQGQALRYVKALPRLVIAPLPANAQPITANAMTVQRAWSFSAIAFALWLIGACLMLARLLVGLHRMRRIRRNALPITAAELDCGELATRRIPLRLTDAIQSPVLHGVARPLILLPSDFAEWTSVTERRAMIEHELAHVRRRDHFTNVLLNALNVIFYFHPLVRLACRHLRLEREIACDDCVVNAGADATVYAESILKAAERSLLQPGWAASHQPAFLSNKQTLERRIEMIMNTTHARVLTHSWRYLVLPLALLLIAGWLITPQPQAQSAVPYPTGTDTEIITALLRQAAEAVTNRNLIISDDLSFADFIGVESEDRMSHDLMVVRSHNHRVMQIEVDDVRIEFNGAMAQVNFLGKIHFVRSTDGQAVAMPQRYAVWLYKFKDRWKARRPNDPNRANDFISLEPDMNLAKLPNTPPRPISPLPEEVTGLRLSGMVMNAKPESFQVVSENPIAVKIGDDVFRAAKGFGKANWYYLLERCEVEFDGKKYYVSGAVFLRYQPKQRVVEVWTGSGGKFYRTSQLTGESQTFQELIRTMQ